MILERNTAAAELPATAFLYGNSAESRARPVLRWLQIATAIGGVLAASACGPHGSNGSKGGSSARTSLKSAPAAATLEASRPHHCLGDETSTTASASAGAAASGLDATEICLYDDGSDEGGIFEAVEPHRLKQRLRFTNKSGQLCIDSLPGDKPRIHVCPAPFTPPFELPSPTS